MKIDELKTWRDLDHFLKKQFKKFERWEAWKVFVTYDGFESYEKLLWEDSYKLQTKLERHLRVFIATGRWPDLLPTEKYFCRCRILYAVQVLKLLQVPRIKERIQPIQEPPSSLSGHDLLVWLLITNWDHFGAHDWHEGLYRTWQRAMKSEKFDTEDKERFKQWFKIVHLVAEELSTSVKTKQKGHGISKKHKMYKCLLTLENGEKYSAWLPSERPPTIEFVREAYRTQSKCFYKINS
jgi:hypothetical protein